MCEPVGEQKRKGRISKGALGVGRCEAGSLTMETCNGIAERSRRGQKVDTSSEVARQDKGTSSESQGEAFRS